MKTGGLVPVSLSQYLPDLIFVLTPQWGKGITKND